MHKSGFTAIITNNIIPDTHELCKQKPSAQSVYNVILISLLYLKSTRTRNAIKQFDLRLKFIIHIRAIWLNKS